MKAYCWRQRISHRLPPRCSVHTVAALAVVAGLLLLLLLLLLPLLLVV